MERTRWNDDLETWCDERYYRKDEVDEMISQLELNSGLVFSVEVEDEVFSVDSGVQEFKANLSWSNGTGVDGKNVLFSLVDGNNNVLDTSLVTTDVDGYAVYEYTPNGRGQVFVTASYGTLLQETFVVWDTLFKDIGNTDNSSNWNLSVVSYTQTDDYITLDNSSGASRWIYPKVNGSQSILDSNTDYCLEIDLKNVDATNLRFSLDGTAIDNIHGLITTTGFTTVQIYTAKSENKVYYVVNNVTRNVTASTPTGEIYIRLLNGETFQFKNMKVYPI